MTQNESVIHQWETDGTDPDEGAAFWVCAECRERITTTLGEEPDPGVCRGAPKGRTNMTLEQEQEELRRARSSTAYRKLFGGRS